MWTATNEQDARLVARAQRGVSSPAYEPGPYAPTEYQVEAFVSWYVARLREESRLTAMGRALGEGPRR